MAAIKQVLKLTHNEAVVKITNATADNASIDLQTDLKLTDEVLESNQTVHISKILFCVSPVSGASITVTRNSVAEATLFGSGEFDFSANGMAESHNATHDITVTFAGTGGTVYLKLKKVDGYEG
jgi:hypothetical protein